MSKRFILTAASIFILWGSAQAAPADELDTCNRQYHDGNFEQAIACYENIGTSAELLFNIGNSYAQMGRHGYAVLYYLRALCLSPGDTDIQANLTHIRKEHSLFPPEPSLYDQVFTALTISQWSYVCLAVLVLYLGFLGTLLYKKKNRTTIGTVTIVCLILFTLSAAGARYQYGQWQRSVVVEDDRLLVSPFDKSESVGSISQGRLVTPHQTYHEYTYVTDETGRKGWLHSKSRQPILPGDE